MEIEYNDSKNNDNDDDDNRLYSTRHKDYNVQFLIAFGIVASAKQFKELDLTRRPRAHMVF